MSDDRAYYSSLGVIVAVRCADGPTRAQIDDLYAACRVGASAHADLELEIDLDGATGVYDLRADGAPCARSTDRDELLEWVAWKLNSVAVEHERSELVLHAAAVAREGGAVIVTGASGAGKSTLAAALTLRGAAYMGDDSLVVDAAMQLRANPKPIAVDDASRAAIAGIAPIGTTLGAGRQLVAPQVLGDVVAADGTATAVVIVHSTYRSGAPTTVTAMTPAAAAELLADQSFNFSPLGAVALRAVSTLARRARAVAIEFGDLSSAVDAISAAVANATAAGPPGAVDPVVPTRPGLDVELLSGEALVWNVRTRELHHLSASATAIWLACEMSTDPENVAAVVGAVWSALPTDIVGEIARCIGDLTGLGLLGQDFTPR
jgi:hypothetical protein